MEKARQLTVGDPLEDNKQGAIVSKVHFDKIMQCIATARQEGGKLLLGGEAVKPAGRCSNGYFIQPTIIEGLNAKCKTNMEEIFGPVVTLQQFNSIEEALELANATEYGLAATVWSQDISKANIIRKRIPPADCS